MEAEKIDEERIKEIEHFRRQIILEWRNSVQEALDAGPNKAKRSQYDIRSSFSSSSSSSSPLPPPDYQASWRSKFTVWPWLLRASHSCGNSLLLAITKSSSLAVENCDYRDSLNVLGVDNVEYQWQTWDVTLNRNTSGPSGEM